MTALYAKSDQAINEQCKVTKLLFLQCEGTEWWVGCRITAYAPCMLTKVLPLVAE